MHTRRSPRLFSPCHSAALVLLLTAVYLVYSSSIPDTTKAKALVPAMSSDEHPPICSTVESDGNVKIYKFWVGRERLSWKEAAERLSEDVSFQDHVTSLLQKSSFKAFFWECAPFVPARADSTPFEFALVNSGALAKVKENINPFREFLQARENEGKEVVAFPNLGRDATLVVPMKKHAMSNAHMAVVMRQGEEEQVRALWRKVGEELGQRISKGDTRHCWLSTSGLGVYYLHIRISIVPKYYVYEPYTKKSFQYSFTQHECMR